MYSINEAILGEEDATSTGHDADEDLGFNAQQHWEVVIPLWYASFGIQTAAGVVLYEASPKVIFFCCC